jgi:metal-responsive CopG/Arc/MetJ family transcriptional regulator
MKTVKTAISIQKSLYDQADNLARKLNMSRSHLFVLAVEDFIQRYQNRSLLNDLNNAYSDEPDLAEQTRLSRMRKHHRQLVEGEW